MTDPQPEPTMGDVLSAISALSRAVAEVSATQRVQGQELRDLSQYTREGFERLGADVTAVKADVAAVKADTTSIHRYVAELQDSLHIHRADPDAHGRAA